MGIEKITKIEDITSRWRKPDVYDIQTSGGGTFVLNGIIVHNSAVEFGSEAHSYAGTEQTVHIKEHKRKSYFRKDGKFIQSSRVKAHDVKYTDKKLIGFRPKLSKFERGEMIVRVMKEMPARKGQFFLTRSTRLELPKLPIDIEFFLRNLEKR